MAEVNTDQDEPGEPPRLTRANGVVKGANQRGLLLEGWQHWRHYHAQVSERSRELSAGARVQVGVDPAGLIRSVELLAPSPEGLPRRPVDRDHRILRQAVLNTATSILSSSGPVDPEAVLTLAARLEAWVLREG